MHMLLLLLHLFFSDNLMLEYFIMEALAIRDWLPGYDLLFADFKLWPFELSFQKQPVEKFRISF